MKVILDSVTSTANYYRNVYDEPKYRARIIPGRKEYQEICSGCPYRDSEKKICLKNKDIPNKEMIDCNFGHGFPDGCPLEISDQPFVSDPYPGRNMMR